MGKLVSLKTQSVGAAVNLGSLAPGTISIIPVIDNDYSVLTACQAWEKYFICVVFINSHSNSFSCLIALFGTFSITLNGCNTENILVLSLILG